LARRALALLISRLLLTVLADFLRIVSPVWLTISRPITAAAPAVAESLNMLFRP
jgi:hypothetical protein